MHNRPELLAPAQDWNSLKFIKGLTDAVYFGVEDYNMRMKARNFQRSELKEIAEFCHSQEPRMKAYLCTNILIYDSELKDVENLIKEAKKAGIDAIIAHDLAVMNIARRNQIDFHISTQVNISNIEAARFYEDLGAKRIVLARELSLKQITVIKNQLKRTQIECFIHGSMCTSISGRCYFSATICESEDYSANRGNCVQPCRREWRVIDDENNEFIYDGQLFLNTKDLCMIEHVPDLIKANIDSFKIEGRMKDPIYIKTVVECYREARDSYYNNTYTDEKVDEWLERLSKVYNRGFHSGFYFQKPTTEDIELKKRGNISAYKKQYLGKVLSFHPESMTANISMEYKNVPLKIGDEIIIIGMNTYNIEKVNKMYIKGNNINNIMRKASEAPIKVNLRLNDKVQKYDKIYIISKAENLKF